jgi:hypothetical protein
VPVDRPDRAGDPDEPGRRGRPDGPQPHYGPGRADVAPLPLDTAANEAIHRAYRTLVNQVRAAHAESAQDGTHHEAADDSADRGSWAEALPSLRAAWEKRENQYPERERVTPVTPHGRLLVLRRNAQANPGQNAEATKACADTHDEGERIALAWSTTTGKSMRPSRAT